MNTAIVTETKTSKRKYTPRKTVAQREAELREEFRVEMEATTKRLRAENDCIIKTLKESHRDQILKLRTEVIGDLEKDYQVNVAMIEARVLDDLISQQPATHYDQLLAMLAPTQLKVKTWQFDDRKYIKIGSDYSYAIWNFDLSGTFIYQSQTEFDPEECSD